MLILEKVENIERFDSLNKKAILKLEDGVAIEVPYLESTDDKIDLIRTSLLGKKLGIIFNREGTRVTLIPIPPL
ncbi:hypothetical protein ACFL0A_00535 [Patescibacteria group bacterium]